MEPEICARAAATFARQPFLAHLGARLIRASKGICVIEVAFSEGLTQQNGYFHAGVTATLADTAAGLAALTLMPAGSTVLTTEFKINLVAPAAGARMRATGDVLKSGRRLFVVRSTVEIVGEDEMFECAHFLGTMIPITTRPERDPAAEG